MYCPAFLLLFLFLLLLFLLLLLLHFPCIHLLSSKSFMHTFYYTLFFLAFIYTYLCCFTIFLLSLLRKHKGKERVTGCYKGYVLYCISAAQKCSKRRGCLQEKLQWKVRLQDTGRKCHEGVCVCVWVCVWVWVCVDVGVYTCVGGVQYTQYIFFRRNR